LEHQCAVRESERKYDLEIQLLRTELENRNRRMREELEQTHKLRLEEAIDLNRHKVQSLNSELSHSQLLIEELEASHSQAVENLKEEYQNDLASLERNHAALTSALLSDHRQEVSKLSSQITNEQQKAQILHERLSSKQEEAQRNLTESLSDQLDRLLHEHQKELNEQMSAISQLRGENDSLSKLNIQLESELALEREVKFRIEENLKDTLNSAADIEKRSTTELEKMREDIKSQLTQLHSDYQMRMNNQEASHQLEIEEFRITHNQSFEKLNQQLSEVRSAHEIAIRSLSAESEMKLLTALSDQSHRLQAEYQRQLESSEATLVLEIQHDNEERVSELLIQHESEIRSIRESYENEMMRIKDIHTDEITSFQIQTNHTITELQQLVRVMKNDLQEKDSRMSTMSESIDEHVVQHKKLQLKVEQIQIEYQGRLETMQRRYDEAVSGLNAKRSEEISSLKSFFESQNRLQTLQLECDRQIGSKEEFELREQNIVATYEDQLSQLRQTLQENVETSAQEISRLQAALATIETQMKISQKRSDELAVMNEESMSRSQVKLKSLSDRITLLETENLELKEQSRAKDQLLEFEKLNLSQGITSTRQQLQSQLDDQREDLQRNYSTLLLQEFEKLQNLLQSHNQASAISRIEGKLPLLLLLTFHFFIQMTDIQEKFLSIIENLPDNIQNQMRKDHRPMQGSVPLPSSHPTSMRSDAIKKKRQTVETVTWKNLQSSDKRDRSHTHQSHFIEHSTHNRSLTLDTGHSEQHSHFIQTNNGTRNDSTDQLMTAILDGDIQGIRSIVRSRGDSLQSEYWKDVCTSILPIHRAIAGLHFHGNGTILVHTIETLIQLGANANLQDSAGNTTLHKVCFLSFSTFFMTSCLKAIQVCTSTNIVQVVEVLLKKGVSTTATNTAGLTCLHLECSR
jgi:hypothetical protein